MLLGNRPPPDMLQGGRRNRFDAKAHRPQPGSVHGRQQGGIQPIEARLALEGMCQSAPANTVAERENTIALL